MDTNHQDHDWERLARYLAGESSKAERAEVDAWLAADSTRRELLARLKPGWELAGRGADEPATDVDAAWSRMSASIDKHEAASVRGVGERRYAPLLRAAAVLVLVSGSVLAWRAWVARSGMGTTPIVVAARTFVTTPGERRTITLEDSTEIVLGVASRLMVAAGYGASSREMTLDGEALFRVRHDVARPFRVRAGGAVTEDLGTEFAVRAYAGNDTIRVVVGEGSVALRRQDADSASGAVVRAGETGVLPGSGRPIIARTINGGASLAFARGQLVFDNVSMTRVAEELERWYDVDVTLANESLGARHVTVTFSGEPVDEVLRVIALSIGARVEHRGRAVTFVGQ
jgi:ferric-dicitrate binding protein FerR (iron transport regulator)